MRFLRGLAGAAMVAGAGGLCVWAGHIGSAGWWRGVVTLLIGVLALMVLAFVVPVIALENWEGVGCLATFPALILIIATTWLTAIDIEVHTGQWKPVTVMAEHCASTDSGCQWEYRVSDPKTEQDLGWITCDESTLDPGDHTRLHYDPTGHHRPNLEPCAHTAPGWTTALHIAWGIWAAVMLAVIIGTVFEEWWT
ncbi:hypothetical protein [Dactylosporangium matsuzakiense]|uniref:DUF3592 domain-containing protein n=1 Tax=Dactylosporangium matsuzakiense TaxID=53360 RepID=A0A9W6KVA8_9ACTN|nr:hypothetical protein [Dactylosporangium matsuzakiense]UWZ47731.1 hypothetical protein Dmats_15795 [Dactylosporangium matsuzakiense]GLL06114.1 hypothetical protein GCM10017581_078620 [Dactylosporangium matsuzakiense]